MMMKKPMTIDEMKKTIKILKNLNKELREDNDKFYLKKYLQKRNNVV